MKPKRKQKLKASRKQSNKSDATRRDFSDFGDWRPLAKKLYAFEKEHGWKTLFYAMLKYQRIFHKDNGYNFGDSGR